MLWVEKYRPRKLEDLVISKKLLDEILRWAREWDSHRKPLLLAGPPGTGKTSLALALANSLGWETVELNASDQRSWPVISRIVGEGAFNETLSEDGEFLRASEGRRKVIILDEVDNLHKKEDAGGEGALLKIIKRKPLQPMILIANDPFALSKELRGHCKVINFRRVDYRSIVKVLQRICSLEGIKAEKDALLLIAKNSAGDLRAAINDLQAAAEGKKKLTVEDVATSVRTQQTDIFKVIQKIFKSFDPEVYSMAMLLDETPDNIIWWVSENLPLEYEGDDMLKASLVLSRADIFLGRVRKRQFYRLWKYAGYLMTVGVQQSKKEVKRGFTRYKVPSMWQRYAYTRSRREKLKRVLARIARFSHLSTKKAYTEMFYLIRSLIVDLDVERAAKIAAFYEFDKDDLEFITGDEKKAERIWKFIEEKNLHRVDESFLSGYEGGYQAYQLQQPQSLTAEDEEIEGEQAEKEEKEDIEETKKRKRAKTATLDSFFTTE